MQLLRATCLDVGQAGEQPVAPGLEVAQRQQARGAVRRDVGVDATAGAGLQVLHHRPREVALELRDLAAELPTRGVLVAPEVAWDGLARGGVVADRTREHRGRLVLLTHRFQCFDPAHRHPLATSSSSDRSTGAHPRRPGPTPYADGRAFAARDEPGCLGTGRGQAIRTSLRHVSSAACTSRAGTPGTCST